MTRDLSRRTVLRGLIAGPMIVQASSLMPVTSRWLKKLELSKIRRGLRWGDQIIYGGRRFVVTGIGLTIDSINPGYSYADVRAIGIDPLAAPRHTFIGAKPAAIDVADVGARLIRHERSVEAHEQWVVGAHTPFMAMGRVTEELSFRCDLDLVGP